MANAGPGQVGDALLERGTQLAALAGMLAEVRASSSGRLVAVGGEAGVGKTALLQCFCRAEVRAGHALWGACAPLRTPRPLGPLVAVADGIGGEFEQVVTAAGRPHEVVGALLPELRRRALTVQAHGGTQLKLGVTRGGLGSRRPFGMKRWLCPRFIPSPAASRLSA
jgi:predicted ATPase